MPALLGKVSVSLIRRFVGSDQVELVKLFEIIVSNEAETQACIDLARSDARLVRRREKMIDEGDCWVVIRPGDDRLEPLSFLPRDGIRVLNEYFDVPLGYAREVISNAAGVLMPESDRINRFIVQVAYEDNPALEDDLMITVLEGEISDRAVLRSLLERAEADERNIAHIGQGIEKGEVWISIEDGSIEDPSPCFHRADAVDALEMYFGIDPELSKKALSKNNVNLLYRQAEAERHKAARNNPGDE